MESVFKEKFEGIGKEIPALREGKPQVTVTDTAVFIGKGCWNMRLGNMKRIFVLLTVFFLTGAFQVMAKTEREIAFQNFKSDFQEWKSKDFSLEVFGKERVHVIGDSDTLFLPKVADEAYERASVVAWKGAVIPCGNFEVAFIRVDCELNHKGWNFTDYMAVTYSQDGIPLDYQVLGREGVAPYMGDVYYFRLKGNLDSMTFESEQASYLNEQQLADYGNQDFEVRRMRYEVCGDGQITGVQTGKAWIEVRERDVEQTPLSFSDYLSLFRSLDSKDRIENLFSLEAREKESQTSIEALSAGYVRRFIPDGIDPTCEKRTIDWMPLYTFRVGEFVVCSLFKSGTEPKVFNFPNREGLLVVYTSDGQMVDARLLARYGDLWGYEIGGNLMPFRLQIKQASLYSISGSVCRITDSEYVIDEKGHIQGGLLQAVEKQPGMDVIKEFW